VVAQVLIDGLGPEATQHARAWLQDLFGRETFATVRLSSVFARVLILALRAAPYKRAEETVISTTTVFLAAALVAVGNTHRLISGELTDTREADQVAEWGTRLAPLEESLQVWVDSFFRERPSFSYSDASSGDTAPEGKRNLRLGPGIRANFAKQNPSSPIQLLPFLAALAEDPQTGLNSK
jgi:hypothetical protein